MKVYIMICEGCYDGEPQDTIVHAYATLERAREELKRAIREELAKGTYFGDIYADPETRDSIVIEKRENSWTAYDDGAYTSNNASYRIVEQEVIGQ